jgi:hypothetical protein
MKEVTGMRFSIRKILLSAAALLVLCWCGCSQTSGASAPVDIDRAQEVLQIALDGWQAKQSVQDVRSASGIIVQDKDWETGMRLLSYEIKGPGKAQHAYLRCPVELVLEDSKRKESRKTVHYIVSTSPHVMVRRDVLTQ